MAKVTNAISEASARAALIWLSARAGPLRADPRRALARIRNSPQHRGFEEEVAAAMELGLEPGPPAVLDRLRPLSFQSLAARAGARLQHGGARHPRYDVPPQVLYTSRVRAPQP